MGIWARIKANYRKELLRNRLEIIELWRRHLDPDNLEAKERAGRPDSYTLARCDVAAAKLTALGNELYPSIRWQSYDEGENILAQVRIMLSYHDIACVETISLEVAEKQDKAGVVQMLIKDFADRLLSLWSNTHAEKKEKTEWLTISPRS